MSESTHTHHGPNSLVWGARPCNEETDKYPIKPGLVGYEDLLCQLAQHFRDIDSRLNSQVVEKPPVSKVLIRKDGTWTAPKRGYYNFEICGGGGGGYIGNYVPTNTLYSKGGGSGGLRFESVLMEEGETAEIIIGDGGLGCHFKNSDKPGTDGGDTIVTIGGQSFISTGGKFTAGYSTPDNSIPSAGGIPNGVDGEAIQQEANPDNSKVIYRRAAGGVGGAYGGRGGDSGGASNGRDIADWSALTGGHSGEPGYVLIEF